MEIMYPLKLKIFLWPCLQNKILTWDNLLRRVFSGHGYCSLCKATNEAITHMFLHYSFIQEVWLEVCNLLKFNDGQEGTYFQSCMYDQFNKPMKYKELPLFIIWYIWKARNQSIFEDKMPSLYSISAIYIVFFFDFAKERKHKVNKIQISPYFLCLLYFLMVQTLVVGVVLQVNPNHHIHLCMGRGRGTNTK